VSTPLRDVIEIPTTAGAEDYVLRLTDGVDRDHLAATLDSYVVTPEIADAFDRALAIVDDAVRTGTSRASFLSGSFGSGKSHFMAVLHAVLGHDPGARKIRPLQNVIAKRDPVLENRRILRLAFHMLTAESMEQAILGGYREQIRDLRPEADLPAIHHSDAILDDAERMRAMRGDEAFLADLGGGSSSGGQPAAGDIWSRVGLLDGNAWTLETYNQARAAAPGTPERQRLVTALAKAYFSSYTAQAGYVDLDTGLAAIARHAKGLGYDAIVLFLDELVLWLAYKVRDRAFFAREAPKLTKLVESSTGPRAIPLVSFVARQLDLRKWYADSGASGAEQKVLDEALRHQDGRFVTIELGDGNLPFVAEQRLLKPKDDLAKQQLRDAFARLERRPELWNVLLDGVNTDDRHRGADEEAFRRTYPFSPALVSTLRSLAGVMQRERTALKVMQKMLVDRRMELTIDDVIPVGDAFDDIVEGQEPLDHTAANRFRAASTLLRDKLWPAILANHNVTQQVLAADPNQWTPALRADQRIAKTLLLAAVAPDVPALKDLTASRLASLNHGSIVSPLPGGEGPVVLAKVRGWSSKVPEIQIGDEPRHPVIRVRLAEVNYESVVDKAREEDNEGRRRELIKTLVHEALGVSARTLDVYGAITHPVVWRGSAREVDLVFGNIRDRSWITEDHLRNRPGTWRFAVDYPFGDTDGSVRATFARIDQLKAVVSAQTVLWVPRHLSDETMRDLRRLVVLEWLFTGPGDRWTSYSDHLAEADRMEARAILSAQRLTLRSQIVASIQQAYGAATPMKGVLVDDAAHERILDSLDAALGAPAEPVGVDLRAAFDNLIDRAFASSFPAHPRFEPGDVEVRSRDLAIVATYIERAVSSADGRVIVDSADRPAMRRITGELRLGSTGETAFVFGDDQFAFWTGHLERAASAAGVGPHDPVRVRQLREWIERIEPAMGLRREVVDLVILAWATLRQRAWYLNGPIAAPRPGALRDEAELRPEPMPTKANWTVAVKRAGLLFGVPVSPHLTSAAVGDFEQKVRAEATKRVGDAGRLVDALQTAYGRFGLATDASDGRLATARAAMLLVDALTSASDRIRLVGILAGDSPAVPASSDAVTDDALLRSLANAAAVTTALTDYKWDYLTPLMVGGREDRLGWDDQIRADAVAILDQLAEALHSDEIAIQLIRQLDRTTDAVFALMARQSGPKKAQPDEQKPSQEEQSGGTKENKPAPADPPDHGGVPGQRGTVIRRRGAGLDEILTCLRQVLADHADADVEISWRVLP